MLHTSSGMLFPSKIEIYDRKNTTTFAEDGSDVAVTYQTESGVGRTEITVYVTWDARTPLQDVRDMAEQAITMRFNSAASEARFDLPLNGHPDIVAPVSLFRTHISGTEVITGVWLARVNGWIVKVRMTYSSHYRDTMMEMTAKLMAKDDVEVPLRLRDAGLNMVTKLIEGLDWAGLEKGP
ncbi:MAG: hypothetical protein IID51_13120 [Proteobacteria bacterium]|nr:hypothetical protein [Pseudomonadota bacterium]